MLNSSISQYRDNQISSASPEKTVLMLYDGAIGFLRSAIREVDVNRNIPEKARLLEKTVKIIDYLQSCLDRDKGKEISTNLDDLYKYMSIRLTKANLKNDTTIMNEVLNLLLTIRDGWNDMCTNHNKENLTAPSASCSAKGEAGSTAEPCMKTGVGIKV